MTTTLDVLVAGGDRVAVLAATYELEAAGHRVHLCYEPYGPAFPCAGMVDGGECPLDAPASVALLVRRGIHPAPRPREDGARCAIRAGVPLVEDGPEILDPLAPWVVERVAPGGDVVAACETAAARRYDPIRDLVRQRVSDRAGVTEAEVGCEAWSEGADLTVDVSVPVPVDQRLGHALAVRTLDAVRDAGVSHQQVHVRVHEATS